MPIKILTYSNPYEIDCENFWLDIRDCVHFCVSQTMVNGMYETYPHWKKRRQIATVQSLTNALYSEWDSINIKIRQIMEVDSAINALCTDNHDEANIKRSLLFNTKSIAESIRILSELGIKHTDLNKENLNIDQQYLTDIYSIICRRSNSSFKFEHVTNENTINTALKNAIASKNKEVKLEEIDFDTVVIHGIHQFSPSVLCAIEDIAKFKNVILMFNYQSQYQVVYETWLNIYSLFEKKINVSTDNQFTPVPLFVNSYSSNLLGDYIGKLSNGVYSEYNPELEDLEIVEFENITEFANYAASIFEAAKRISDASEKKSPVAFMKEQLYSASNKVNDILRAYFPEQFGERHFLDYPIGHFFVATANMWDSERACAVIVDFSDIRECLGAGIISESKPGVLLSTFDKTLTYFEKEDTLTGVIKKLKNLLKYINREQPEVARIGYFNVSKADLKELINALGELNEIICSFFVDFNNGGDNFQRFYARIQKFIVNRINNLSDLDDEMKSVIQKLLERIENANLPDTGTFNCLRQTMSFYLSQDNNLNRGAQWIVRGFEQIDGDILRSNNQDPNKINCYHFCCLSDKDICTEKNAKLPWPLDIQFFEYAHAGTEQKYRIFVKSKMEYHNFNRYALLYGLQFNRLNCKLSYVKSEDGKENDLFYMLSLLGIKVKKYKSYENNNYAHHLEYHSNNPNSLEDKVRHLSEVDLYKVRICPYRFVLETFVQEKTEYREQFLVHTYLRVLIANKIILQKNGDVFVEPQLRELILQVYQDFSDKFKLADEIEKTKLIASVYKDIKSYYVKNNQYRFLTKDERDKLKIKEDLLLVDLRNFSEDTDTNLKEFLETGKYRCVHGIHCKYCASKDVCLEHSYNQED